MLSMNIIQTEENNFAIAAYVFMGTTCIFTNWQKEAEDVFRAKNCTKVLF